MSRLLLAFLFFAGLTSSAFAAEKMPLELAGEPGKPTGKIAFVRDGNIWMMNADGNNQVLVTEVTNADGLLTWSPDNTQIIFTRSGILDLKGPALLGGKHKVYDLFIAYPDSAINGNNSWWFRISDDLGSRDPQWNKESNRITFWKDMNADQANAQKPNYQACTMAPDGSDITILRKDWQNMEEEFMITPSMNSKGDIAFVYFFDNKPQGLAVLTSDSYMASTDSVKAQARANLNRVAPVWSPDGKWLSFINKDFNDASLYIATPDLKEIYLVFQPPVSTYMFTHTPSFSPDSKWLTFATSDGSVWICDIGGKGARRLTPPGLDRTPAWSK